MTVSSQWNHRIRRRLKLRDVDILLAVIQMGSMGKAADALNMSQPAVSKAIAGLEHTLGVRLLDRHRHGIEPTDYGRALFDGGVAMFDDLHQAVKNIEFLTDPTVGEIRVAGNEPIIAGLIAMVFGRLRRKHPGIAIDVATVVAASEQFRELRERKVDLVIGRVTRSTEDDIHTEILFQDRIVVVAGLRNRWARHRKVVLSDLADAPWVLPPRDSVIEPFIAEAFRASGIGFPPRGVARGAVHLLRALLANGPFLGFHPISLLHFDANRPSLQILPVKLPIPPWPVGIMTLKNRTTSPAVQLFIDCLREVAKPLNRRR